MNNIGYIYILTNPGFPDYIKIGYATDVNKRLKELNRSECIPYAFRLYAYYKVNTPLTDKAVHRIIDNINPDLRTIEHFEGKQRKREFYAMSPETAYNILEGIAEINGLLDNLFLNKKEQKDIVDEKMAEEISEYSEEKFLKQYPNVNELYLKLKEYKEKTERPIWVYMESYCCSGGVYIASVADEQYANRITTTGSIGVIMSNYDTTKLYKKLGIKTDNIVSGNNKDMGAGGKSMTDEQRAIYQSVVDEYYERFVEIVAEGRDMSVEEVKKLADGRIYTAEQATENGLIDGIKQSEEFDEYVKAQSGVDYFYEPKSNQSYWSDLFAQIKSMKTKSESEVLLEAVDQLGNGGPMYYAEPYSR